MSRLCNLHCTNPFPDGALAHARVAASQRTGDTASATRRDSPACTAAGSAPHPSVAWAEQRKGGPAHAVRGRPWGEVPSAAGRAIRRGEPTG
ncbi:hypothetical protein FU139_21545 [Burkholderia territorii]|nr:hypothetical protein FU139_21545 [Burkholderia territorii]